MNKKVFILFLLVLLFPGCLHIQHKKNQVNSTIKNLYLDALGLIGQEAYEDAESLLKQIIREDKGFYLAYESLVDVYGENNSLDQAASYFKELDDTSNPFPAWALGLLYTRTGEYDKAIGYFKKSIEIESNFYGHYRGLVTAYLHKSEGDENLLEEAETYLHELGRRNPDNGGFHYGLSYLFLRQHKFEKALAQCNKAVAAHFSPAQTSYVIGVIHFYTSSFEAAIKQYEKALLFFRETGDKKREAKLMCNIGDIYYRLADSEKSLEYLEKSLAIQQQISDRNEEARSLNIIGVVYYDLVGDYEKALDYINRSLSINKKAGNSSSIGNNLNNMGIIYYVQSNYPGSLECYEEALKLAEKTGDTRTECLILNNIGLIYYEISAYEKALEYFEKSLLIAKKIDDLWAEGLVTGNMGMVFEEAADYTKVLEYFNKSLAIAREIGNKKSEGFCLNNIGSMYYALSDYPKALEYLEKALLVSKKIGNKLGEGYALNDSGIIYYKLSDYPRAFEYFEKALAIRKQIGDKEGESETLGQLGNVYLALKEYQKAFSFYKEAIKITEQVRGNFKNEAYKTGYFQMKGELYDNLISCLYSLQAQSKSPEYGKLAFRYAEQSKARGLLDLLTESRADIKQGIDPQLRRQERDLEHRYTRIHTQLLQELSLADDTINREKTASLEEDLKKIESSLDQVKQKIIRTNPRYGQIKYPGPVTIEEVQKTLLDSRRVVLTYKVTKEALFTWLITEDDCRFFKQEITEEYLSAKIAALRNCFSRTPLSLIDYAPVCDELFTILIKPFLEGVDQKEELLIIPDGILHYLPFETLAEIAPGKTGEEKEALYGELTDNNLPFLLNKYTVTYAQSATVACNNAKEKRKASRKGDLFAMGDPVVSGNEPGKADFYTRSALFEDQPARGRKKLERLVYSGEEVKNIGAFFEKKRVYIREEATEEIIKEAGNLKQFRYIHLAAHSILNENKPQFSGIVLTQDADPREDGYLQTREIFNIEINADLVVLSACQTGLGKQVKGEGLIGLTRAWMYAGTPSVVVSLWPVDDKSTSLLMTDFYRNINTGMNHSQALRQAKLALLEKNSGEFSHPVFWAGFILMGGKR